MKASAGCSPSREVKDSTVLVSAAHSVAAALDRILDCMMSLGPDGDAVLEVPLTFSEARVVRRIPRTGRISMRPLADSLGISLPTATHMVDRLVAKGIVVRVRPECDRRLVLVELSEKLRVHRDALFRSRVELIQQILGPHSLEAQGAVARVLTDIALAAPRKDMAVEAKQAQRGSGDGLGSALSNSQTGKRSCYASCYPVDGLNY